MQLRSLAVWIACALALAGPAGAATLTVTDTGDAGDGTCDASCTLRDAVDAAASDDRILFDLALPAPILIGLSGGALQIDVPLRITATDGVRTTVRRVGGNGRLLDVVGSGDARVIGLSFEHGDAPAPFGVSADGGAIFIAAGAALELRNCVLRGNRAIGASGDPMVLSPGSPANGGAIYAAGDLLVDGCAFVDNHASGGDGASDLVSAGTMGGAASGGAIHALATIDILNSTFSGNSAMGGSGAPGAPGSNGGDGGPAAGGAIALAASALPTIAFSTLIGNSVAGGAGGIGGPGGEPLPATNPARPDGLNGADGTARGAALDAAASTLLNVSVLAANTGATQCSGATISARTSNSVADASCPGVVVAALEAQFEPIDAASDSPHYRPKLSSVVVDSAADCLDAVAFEAVDFDQLLTPRPLTVNAPAGRCDIGAIELNPVLFGDGFEEPPPPP